jgi:putative ABC transport system permease protein
VTAVLSRQAAVQVGLPSAEVRAKPIATRASIFSRFRTMALVGVRMMFFDKLKLIGTLFGVVFAVVEKVDSDLWILPTGAETVAPGKVLPYSDALQAETVEGVEWASPMLLGAGTVQLPGGGTEAVTILGLKSPHYSNGPWNVVKGDRSVLSRPDTMFFEDGDREVLGGINLGSVREVNGRKITVGGFTWGLIPFGPSYAIADFELARELLKTPNDRVNYVTVKVKKGADVKAVQRELKSRVGLSQVVTKQEFNAIILNNIFKKTAIGITFLSTTTFAVIVGLVIVALAMFSAVVDNIREFGTLKAVGAKNLDLAMLLFVLYGSIGSTIGLALVSQMAKGIRSAKLTLVMPPQLTFGTFFFMIVMCCLASGLALLRLRKVEPAMVFR